MSTIYFIDANALIDASHQYNMSKQVFLPVWEKLDEMADSGELKSSVEIRPELKDEDIEKWARLHSEIFLPLSKEVQETTIEILNKYPSLIQIKSTANSNGDPFLIATAKVNSGIIITNEKPGDTKNAKNYKIPNVCNEMGIPWMNLHDFIDTIVE